MRTGTHETPSVDWAARPNVVAFVAPTTIRFIVLIGALLSAGLFMGTWLHNESPVGDDWARRVAECQADPAPPTTAEDWLAHIQEQQRCTAGVEQRRFLFAVGGAGMALVAGLAVAFAAPGIIEQRRLLRPVGPRLAHATARFQALGREAGLARPAALLMGSATLRDAFSYGVPRRYRVAVAPAVLVRWRDGATFDPLIRHELAHVQHHDVAIAWIARSMWMVVVPLLALPVVWGVLSGDMSVLPSYLWRAVLLAAVTLLAASALLRSREYDADLRAAPTPQHADELSSLLHRISTPRHLGWGRLFAYHPPAEDRLAVLRNPGRHATVTFIDGLATGFLVALTLPLIRALMSTTSGEMAFVVPALVLGPLLGATVGFGLWRQSLVQRITGDRLDGTSVVAGVFAGYGLGEVVSLAQTGSTSIGEYNHPAVYVVTAFAVCAAAAVAAGLGEVFADAAPRFRTPRGLWVTCLVSVGVLFGRRCGPPRSSASYLM